MQDASRVAIFAENNIEEAGKMYLNRLRMTRKPAETAAFLSQAIMTLPMCADATDQILQRLVEACEPCRLQPREVAVRMGQRNDYFFMLQAGRITITKGDSISSSSKEEALNPGNTFGQEALARGAPADFTAIAGGGCLLWRLHRTAFKLLQMDSGVRMRNAIGNVLDARRQGRFGGQVGQPSALQLIVLQAQERKRLEANAQDRQQEFSDVQDALQKCEPVAVLGKGNFGEVRLVVHKPTRHAFALKSQGSEHEKREAIVREIACMRAARSPFLVQFHGEHNTLNDSGSGVSSMLLEYLPGGSLDQVMGEHGVSINGSKRKGFEPLQARFYFAGCLAALDGLQSAGWMHRDLKLENVVIDSSGYAKLIDCGLAKKVGSDEHTYTMIGTPTYYAPEMVKHTGYGMKAEVWSLGILLHELLCGEAPFIPDAEAIEGKSPSDKLMELFKLIVRGSPKMDLSCFSHPAKDLILQLLQKLPKNRIGVVEARNAIFFERFSWPAFHTRRMPPPFVPAPHPKLR